MKFCVSLDAQEFKGDLNCHEPEMKYEYVSQDYHKEVRDDRSETNFKNLEIRKSFVRKNVE